jgi:hypothetical protein
MITGSRLDLFEDFLCKKSERLCSTTSEDDTIMDPLIVVEQVSVGLSTGFHFSLSTNFQFQHSRFTLDEHPSPAVSNISKKGRFSN